MEQEEKILEVRIIQKQIANNELMFITQKVV